MLFVDYSSAFNTIVPTTLVAKLQTLGLNRSLCSWILDFLTGRSQVVRMGNKTWSPLILKTGAPQGCVLSPLLLVVDFRRQSREHTPITIDKTPVEQVNSFKFLGVHITEDLTWSAHTDAVLKKAHQRLFFLRRLRKFVMSPSILRSFYSCTVESILTGCITTWFGNKITLIWFDLIWLIFHKTVLHICNSCFSNKEYLSICLHVSTARPLWHFGSLLEC